MINLPIYNHFKSPSTSECVSGLTTIAESYNEAVELLKQRYGNTQILINTHMQQFVSLPVIKSVNDVKGLRKLYENVKSSVKNLKTLDDDSRSYGNLLVLLINAKLPELIETTVLVMNLHNSICTESKKPNDRNHTRSSNQRKTANMNESNTNLNDGTTNNFTSNAINNVNNVSLQTAKVVYFHGYMLMIFEKIIEFENF